MSPPFDLCLPINIVGPFQQTLFLGCSIVSCSASVGWSNQASELTIQLVQDPCPNPAGKIYYDNELNQQIWYNADPGFIGDTLNPYGTPTYNALTDIVGCAAYFRIGNFEYSGIIQSWQRTDSGSSHPTYTVVLQDPRYILETIKLILKDYAGQIILPNVFNVYGFMESLGVACPQVYLNNNGQNPLESTYQTYSVYNDNDGAIIGSPAGGFGGADINPNGMPYSNVIAGFNALANSIPQNINQWSLYGRTVYKSPGNLTMDAHTCGLIMPETLLAAYYFVDLSDLPTAPTYYRINAGTTIDVLTLISTICSDAGYEYYIELLPVYTGSVPYKFIKVRTVRRFSQPSTGVIEQFIGTGNGVINSNYGREARLENTNCMYIGGNKQSLYQIEGENSTAGTSQYLIIPYFGVDQWTQNTIIPTRQAVNTFDNNGVAYTRWEWVISVNATFINARFQVLPHNLGTLMAPPSAGPNTNFPNMYYAKITEIEMMAAIAGFDAWFAFVECMQTDTGKFLLNAPYLKNLGITALGHAVAQFCDNPNTGQPFAGDMRHFMSNISNMVEARKAQQAWDEVKLLYQWVLDFAKNLGVKFQVAVPFTCAHLDIESAQVVTSENPADSGWTEKPYVLQLQNTFTNPIMTFLRKEDNKICAMIAFNDFWYQDSRANSAPYNLRDISKLNESDYVIYNDIIYVKASVETDYVFENYYARTKPRAILTIPGPVYVNGDTMPGDMRLFSEAVNRFIGANVKGLTNDQQNKAIAAARTVMAQDGDSRAFYQPLPYNYDTNPFGAAVGIKSNVLTYGPWVNSPVQPPGGSKIETEAGLVPWEYQGVNNMNIAGNYLANAAITAMRVGDRGSVNGPGYPILPLGAELGASTYLSAGGYSLAQTRQLTLGYANGLSSASVNAGGVWQGIYGPNITSININIGKEGITTEYQMRTYSQKFGRFEKANIDRLKLLAVWQRKFERWIGAIQALQLTSDLNAAVNRGAAPTRVTTEQAQGGAMMDPVAHSPHSVLIGGVTSTGAANSNMTHSITNVFSLPLYELRHEVSNYGTNALMSLDGLLRPVSLSGSAGLPKQANFSDNALSTEGGPQPNTNYAGRPMTIQAMPMVLNLDASWEYDLAVWNQQIHPWQNPASLTGSIFSNPSPQPNRSPGSTNTAGHDIAMLGRGTAFKQSGNMSSYPQFNNINADGSETIYPYDAGASGDYYPDYRGLAYKGPLLLQSWGYDTEGRPVPNAYGDSSGNSGVFGEYGSGEQFMPDFLKQPNYWPVGPVDLRWDRRRGVWTAAPEYSLLVATVTGDICSPGQYWVNVNNNYIIPQNIPAKDQTPLVNHVLNIPVINIYKACYHSGDQVMVWYCAYEKQYYLLAPEIAIVSGFHTTGNCCTCNNINCTGCTSNFGTPNLGMTGVRTFNFSSGFNLTTGNCCTVNIDVVNQGIWVTGSSGNTACCVGAGYGVGQLGMCVNNLWFNPQFNVTPGNNCCADISLAPGASTITISGSTGITNCNCTGHNTFAPNTGICTNNLVFSTDFIVSPGAGNCQSQVALNSGSLVFTVSGYKTEVDSPFDCACEPATQANFVGACTNILSFGSGFTITTGTNCTTSVTLAQQVNAITLTGFANQGNPSCCTPGAPSSPVNICANTIGFASGFEVTAQGNCGAFIELAPLPSPTINIAGPTQCCTAGNSSGCASSLTFGSGFTVSVNACTATVGVCPPPSIVFDSCFTVTPASTCTGNIHVTLNANGSTANSITAVSNISIASCMLSWGLVTLNFSSCGLFVGSTTSAGGPFNLSTCCCSGSSST